MILNGIPVYESLMCLEKTDEPVKKHILKCSMRYTYHNRIQKKWIKRFGYVMKPAMFIMQNKIVCHPSMMKELRNLQEKLDVNDMNQWRL